MMSAFELHQFPCLSDNYGFLIHDTASGQTACVDTPDVEAIDAALDQTGWKLTHIFNTHWHPDHAGGNAALQAKYGCTISAPAEVTDHAPADNIVSGGDEVQLGALNFEVIEAGGHTMGHIIYYCAQADLAFVGDVLFPLGCGRIFEGTPEQMLESLDKIAALPADTKLYSAHEYTQSNARFALHVDDSPALKERAALIDDMRANGLPTVPTTVAQEQATNPFLRASVLRPNAASRVAAFAQLRSQKDNFAG